MVSDCLQHRPAEAEFSHASMIRNYHKDTAELKEHQMGQSKPTRCQGPRDDHDHGSLFQTCDDDDDHARAR